MEKRCFFFLKIIPAGFSDRTRLKRYSEFRKVDFSKLATVVNLPLR